MIKYLFLFYFLITMHDVDACSCVFPERLTKQSALKLTGAYLGRIVLIEKTENDYVLKYSLLVTETYRGKVLDTLVFNASDDAGMCGIDSEIGDEWLVTFNTETEEIPFVSICSRAYNYSQLIHRRKIFRFKYRYGENRYARKELFIARHDLRILKRVK